MSEPQFCSQESIDNSENLVATAPRADVWFLLQYDGRWGKKALAESSIPDAVKEHLNTHLDSILASRLLLIKGAKNEGITFFVALASANPPVLYRFELASYEELLEIDLTALAGQAPEYFQALTVDPVFVNCTNGLRDQCCALHGVASYQALATKYPQWIWQSTHHGGHRFAANFLHLPYGFSYGRLRPDNAADVMAAGLNGKVALDHLRGRTIYEEPAQAAEFLLRQKMGEPGINALRLEEILEEGADRWKAIFTRQEKTYEVDLQRRQTGEQVHVSCGEEKMSPVVEYSLLQVKS